MMIVFYFSNIMNSSIKNVEILRGFQSSMYGSGAIGGAMNIYTKNWEDQKLNKLAVSSGVNGTKNLDGSSGDKYNNNSYSIFLFFIIIINFLLNNYCNYK